MAEGSEGSVVWQITTPVPFERNAPGSETNANIYSMNNLYWRLKLKNVRLHCGDTEHPLMFYVQRSIALL